MNYSINLLQDQKQIIESILKTEFNSKAVANYNVQLADLSNSIEYLKDKAERVEKIETENLTQKMIF